MVEPCPYVDPAGLSCALQHHPDIRVHIVDDLGCWAPRLDVTTQWDNASLHNPEQNRADAPAALKEAS